jgi:hypothetical protein
MGKTKRSRRKRIHRAVGIPLCGSQKTQGDRRLEWLNNLGDKTMAFEPRPNTGILFKNTRKTKDNQPDYTGKWTDSEGNELQLAAWIKEGQKGKFMTLSASEPRERQEDEPRKAG